MSKSTAPSIAPSIPASKLVAHRGLQSQYPENTLLSLNQAIAAGALFVELDVQFSRDKQPIIYHDTDLQRVSGIDNKVSNLTKDQLINYPAYEPQRFGNRYQGEKIAFLESLVSLLQSNPKVTAFVELKPESLAHCTRQHMLLRVSEILAPVVNQVAIISYDYQLINQFREANWPQVGVVLKQWSDIENPIVLNCRPDYIFSDYRIIPEDTALKTIKLFEDGLLAVYEVGSVELALSLLARGVDMIETFNLNDF